MSTPSPGTNQLAVETSPYLLQHKDNPVHWMPWSEAALARARAEGKPILLSIGYAACHWCHVMARESFEDPETAGLMNRLFVSIKVDREERPDLDHVYQMALALMGQHGGWPLTLFLTPSGEPFGGGTYFPPTARYGRPGFRDVLTRVAEAWRREPDVVGRSTEGLLRGLARLGESENGGPVPVSAIDRIAERVIREVDPFLGGIGDAPKFPHGPLFELLWRAWLRTGREPYRVAVTNTLTRMCQGGIYDHLAGGFARYSTDAEWLVPHFEKMLYDNAALIDVLTLVWRGTGERLYAERVAETVGWVLREMVAEGGGFASSLDADSEHEEGKFTVWTEAEIDACLGAGADRFKAAYDVTPGGNWEGATILNRQRRPDLGTPEDEAALAGQRARLLAVRDRRTRPGWDDKVLTDWNGLMIAALARAGQAFGRPDWIAAAQRAFAFVTGAVEVDGRLRHCWRGGAARHAGMLEDYAAMAGAALALAEASGDPGPLARARDWVGVVERHFRDRDQGGYYMTADDAEVPLVRAKSAMESATPSGNGLMAGVLARLFHVTGEDVWRERAEAVIAACSGEVPRNVLGFGTLLNAAELLERAATVVIVGAPGAPDTMALRRAAACSALPDVVTLVAPPDAGFPEGHPAHGKGLAGRSAAAYLCFERTCGPPLTDADALSAALAARCRTNAGS